MSEVDLEPPPTAAVAYQTGDEIAASLPTAADSAFVHLCVHSEFSIGDGLAKVKDLAGRVAELQMPAVALTDRGNLFGLVKFYSACRDVGVKAVIGAELDYEDGENVHRCVVLVACETGYRNLLRLVSSAYTEANGSAAPDEAHAHGRVSRGAILAAAEGLFALLGRDSDVGAKIDKPAAASQRLAEWRRAFGNRLYLEAVRTGRPGEGRFVLDAAALAAAEGVPMVATNDVRFLAAEDFEAHETRVCIQEGRVLDDPRRERRYSEQQYLRGGAEMRELFADLPEALDNSVEIAKRCSYGMQLGTYYLPRYPVAADDTLEALLRRRADDGLQRYLQERAATADARDEPLYRQRLEYELGIVTQMGFAGYFLIVQEFVNWARQHRVPVGCRGSGAASLVAFCLGITDLDPLQYGLIFERLLNPERVSMPDFDIDFCMEGRERVIAHVADLYGHDSVSQIVTFGTMAARLVVRDVARVQGKPFGLADRLSKMIPYELGMTLAKAMEQEQELRDFVERNEDASEIMDMAYKLEGVVRNTGKHAGGVVIAPSALTDFVPLYADQAGGLVSQFDLHDVEEAGLVKFDFLGLKTLTIIDWAVAAINAEREAEGKAPVDAKNLPLDDPATYGFLKTAKTTAVFQLESQGMKDLIARLQPDSIDDIIALVALFRPGPLQSGAVDDYIDRKHGRSPVSFPHPALEEPLKNTYGVMLYQEQVMNMAQRLAGFSLGQADLLRRAMAKKKPEEMVTMRTMFLAGTGAHGVDQRIANDIFDQVEKFAGYAFPKAHAASYALLTFQTAWLKAHHPAQFMAAVLSADMQNIDKVVTLVEEVRRMEINVRPPDVNASGFRFDAGSGDIRYGLGAVRGVGEGPVAAMVAERQERGPFKNLRDFCQRVNPRLANKRLLEALIRAGAMDSLADGESAGDLDARRGHLLDELPDCLQGAEQLARDAELGISDMFGGVEEPAPKQDRRRRALSTQERLEGERETLGLYLTGHPIDAYLPEIRRFCSTAISSLRPGRAKQSVGGLVVSNRARRGRRGDMAFTLLDDRSGRIEANVFGETYAANRAKLVKDAILIVEGEVQADEYADGHKLRAERIMTLTEARNRFAERLRIRAGPDANGDFVEQLKNALRRNRNAEGCRVALDYAVNGAKARIALGDAWRVDASDALLAQLREAFGEQAVELDYPTGAE